MSTLATVSRNRSVPYQDFFTPVPKRGNGRVLHDFDEYSLDGSHGMESMNSILDGVSSCSTLATIDEESKKCTADQTQVVVKPRLRRDLTALMSPANRERIVTGQRTPRNALRARMGSIVSTRALQAQLDVAPIFTRSSYERLDENESLSEQVEPEDEPHHENVIVWEVIPVDCEEKLEERFHRVLFKFSSSNGACFLLKYKYAIQFVQLLKKKTRKNPCTVFYQAYEFDGERSSMFKSKDVQSWLGTTIEIMQAPEIDDDGNEIWDNANIIQKPSEMSLVKRIDRYLNRRRLKKLIRRQLAHSLGRIKRSRGRLFFAPFQFVWSVMTGKPRSSM